MCVGYHFQIFISKFTGKIDCFDLAHLTRPLTFFPKAIIKLVALVVLVQIFSSVALLLGFSAGNDVLLIHMTTL